MQQHTGLSLELFTMCRYSVLFQEARQEVDPNKLVVDNSAAVINLQY